MRAGARCDLCPPRLTLDMVFPPTDVSITSIGQPLSAGLEYQVGQEVAGGRCSSSLPCPGGVRGGRFPPRAHPHLVAGRGLPVLSQTESCHRGQPYQVVYWHADMLTC